MATFKVGAYSSAVNIFIVIPIAGLLIAPVWNLTLWIIGLKNVHSMSYRRVVISILLPMFLITGVVAIQTYVQRALQARVKDAATYLERMENDPKYSGLVDILKDVPKKK